MNKKYASVLIIILLLTFGAGCVQQQTTEPGTNQTPEPLMEIMSEDDLDPALQELEELEGL